MAKKQSPPPAPPHEALPDGEANRYLAKVKASLVKRWSVSKSETLYEIADLAAYLWSLERPGEALAVAAAVAAAVPAPPPLPKDRVNYSLWCPATYSHAFVVHLGTSSKRDEAKASRAALIADAGIARDNPGYLADKVADARQVEAAPLAPKASKWECQTLARAVGCMALYSELAAAGDPIFAPHGSDAAALLPKLLKKLGDRLESA